MTFYLLTDSSPMSFVAIPMVFASPYSVQKVLYILLELLSLSDFEYFNIPPL